MKMIAAIAALESLERPARVTIHGDARFLTNPFASGTVYEWRAKGWRRTRKDYIPDSDLWRVLLDRCEEHAVEFVWLPRHADHPEMARCHRLAIMASSRVGLPVDEGYERQLTRDRSQGRLFE